MDNSYGREKGEKKEEKKREKGREKGVRLRLHSARGPCSAGPAAARPIPGPAPRSPAHGATGATSATIQGTGKEYLT